MKKTRNVYLTEKLFRFIEKRPKKIGTNICTQSVKKRGRDDN